MVHTAPAERWRRRAAPGGRSARKRQAIVEAATALFLEHGYQGTSMDDIAALAAVSKQTVYRTSRTSAAVQRHRAGRRSPGDAFTATLPRVLADTDDLEAGLRALARQYLAIVMQPRRRRCAGTSSPRPAASPPWPAPITSARPNTS